MKVLQISAVRAILVLVIGFLLVKYREETMTWMTITIGILFFLSGLFSCAVYYIEKERVKKQTSESDENNDAVKGPSFPVAGVGSIILGIILAVMPNTFITWVVYILAALLILGAVNQFMNLASSRQFARVPLLFWLFPSVTLGIGIYIIAQPMDAAALPLKVIGWCLMFYGVVELVNAIKINQMKRAYEKIENAKIVNGVKMPSDDKIEDAEIVEE